MNNKNSDQQVNELSNKVFSILQYVLDTNRLMGLDDKYIDIGLNSLQYVTVVVNLESEFNVIFEDDMLVYDDDKTLRDLIHCLSNLINQDSN